MDFSLDVVACLRLAESRGNVADLQTPKLWQCSEGTLASYISSCRDEKSESLDHFLQENCKRPSSS